MSNVSITNPNGGITPVSPDIEFIQGNDGINVGPNPTTHIVLLLGDNDQGVDLSGNAGTYTETITVFDAEEAQKGVVRLATNAESIAGTLTTNVAINPSSLKAKLGAQTSHGLAYGAGTTGAIAWLAEASDGQIPIGDTGGIPILGNITSLDNSLVVTNGPGTINIELNTDIEFLTEWTPYVVDSTVDAAPYTTIQDALDAANGAGGTLVLVRFGAGNYVEDLTLYDGITIQGTQLAGNSSLVTITGNHTPPASGEICFSNLNLADTDAIVTGTGAGTTDIYFSNCNLGVSDGFVVDATDWTGSIFFNGCSSSSVDDGIVNNATGSSVISIIDSVLGGGAGIITTGGSISAKNSTISSKSSLLSTSTVDSINSFWQGMTFAGSSSASFIGGEISGSSVASITQSSSGTILLANVVINSNNNPALAGSGAGVISLVGVPFLNNTVIAGTLTTSVDDWKPYATQGTSVTATNGTSSFDEEYFDVTDGFVTLNDAAKGTAQTIGAVTADIITLPLGATPGAYSIICNVAAFQSAGPSSAQYFILASVRTDGATATVAGDADVTYVEDPALADADCTVVASGNNAIIRATGVTALTIDWAASLTFLFLG